jgi:hypothetical protein
MLGSHLGHGVMERDVARALTESQWLYVMITTLVLSKSPPTTTQLPNVLQATLGEIGETRSPW